MIDKQTSDILRAIRALSPDAREKMLPELLLIAAEGRTTMGAAIERDDRCPLAIGVTAFLGALLVYGLVSGGIAPTLVQFLPHASGAAALAAILLIERRKARCEWLDDSPARRVVLYLLLIVTGALAAAAGWMVATDFRWWVVATVVALFFIPVGATLVIHQRVEHQPLPEGSVRIATWLAAKIPYYVFVFGLVLLGVRIAFVILQAVAEELR